jgi:hypothetical protein
MNTEFLKGKAGGHGMDQEEGKFLTLKISDLRHRLKEKEAPLKSHLDAKLTVQRRPLWLPEPAWAHTEAFRILWPQPTVPILSCTILAAD